MQFKKTASRIQCFAAYWDPVSKRTRQKLVWTMYKSGKITEKPTPEELSPDFGTLEQRQRWADEIATYIDEHNADDEKERADALPRVLKATVDSIYAELRKKPSHLDNPFHLARMRGEVERLGKKLGLVVTRQPNLKKEPAATPKKGTSDAK